MSKFKVGDKVKAFGVEGEVIKIDSTSTWPVVVKFSFSTEAQETFTTDGKLFEWHAEPSLELVERPKPKPKYVKKTWYRAIMEPRRAELPWLDLNNTLFPTVEELRLRRDGFIGYAPIDVWVEEASDE